MQELGLSPLVTIETRCHQLSTSHRAELLIYFRYSSASHTRVWDSDLWWHTKPRYTSTEKKTSTPSLRALHPGTDLWLMPDNSRAIETWTDTSKAQISGCRLQRIHMSYTFAARPLCGRYKILHARGWEMRFPRDLLFDSLTRSSHMFSKLIERTINIR
ncbi:hypothetical protein QQF64_022839 [Cirrhinus molitorella]|uniref:Uncharacterized protein n=1 Tax=Cirrhinus molitorella TaxID=172907 RepID=A0ABR3L3P0_9TELE